MLVQGGAKARSASFLLTEGKAGKINHSFGCILRQNLGSLCQAHAIAKSVLKASSCFRAKTLEVGGTKLS